MNRKLLSLFLLLFLIVGGATSAWADTYQKYSGTITPGKYLIVYGGGAMKASVTSSRLDYADVTEGDAISSTDPSIVWTIAASGDYFTLYNESENSYAAGTGAKNKAQLLSDGTDDKSLWTITGEETYEFVNKANDAANVNKNLRRNGSYGFACYAIGTGGALTLYKLEESSGGGDTPTLDDSDLALTGAPIALSFDLYNNSSAQVINYTTSSTGAVTIAESDYATFSINETAKTITVTPKTAVTPSTQTITVNQAADDTYKAGTATFRLTITNSPTYTVTFSDGGSVTQESYEAAVTLPSRSAIGGYTFAGWSENPVATETTTAQTTIPAGSYTPEADITLYPVYKRIEGDGGSQNMSANVIISAYATANSWISGTQYTSVTIDENVTAVVSNGSGNTGKYYESNNSWRFYANESGALTISTTSGELTSITITYTGNTLTKDGNNVTSGTAVSVSGTSASFSVSGSSSNSQITAISVEYSIEGSGATYYVSAPAQATLNDEDGITALASAAGHGCVVTYTRSFTEGKASTVCLPFDYTKKDGDGSFYEFTGIEQDGEGEYVATMTEPVSTTLEAKKPYLYLPDGDDEVNFGGTYEIPADLTAGSYTSGDWTFKGTFATIEWTSAPAGTYGFSAQNANGISQGEFVKVGNYVRIKPMRCYLQYIGDDSQWAGVRGKNRVAAKLPETIKVRLVGADGTVTAIGSLSTTTGEMTMDGAWYSINGTRLNGTPATKGIYVRNGKKVVIK